MAGDANLEPGRPANIAGSAAERESEQIEALGAAAEKTTLAQLVSDQFSLEKSIGGVRGICESILPVTIFTVWFGITRQINQAAIAAVVVAAFFGVWRLVLRQSPLQAVMGIAGVLISAFFAARTGRAENYFVPAILKNAAFAAGYALSILFRWPIVGVILGFAYGEIFHWREVPARYRVYVQVTWLWAGMFGLRLAVQIPLFLLGRNGNATATQILGYSSIPLGLPLFLVIAYLTWVLVRRVPVARPPENDRPADTHINEG